jgi:microcystin-dependent protein
MAEPFLAEIRMFGINFPPRGWAQCDGQLLPISQNTALFSLLGTTYGGDGHTTFGLPDLRGRTPVHEGHGPGLSGHSLGAKFGTESVALTVAQMPPHGHPAGDSNKVTVSASSAPASESSPVGNSLAAAVSDPRHKGLGYSAAAADTPMATDSLEVAGATAVSSGGGQGHTNMPPYLAIQFCMAIEGLFPTRG